MDTSDTMDAHTLPGTAARRRRSVGGAAGGIDSKAAMRESDEGGASGVGDLGYRE